MKAADRIKKVSFAELIMYISLLAVGVFHVYLSCLLSVALLAWLCVRIIKKGRLCLKWDFCFAAVLIMTVAYAVTPLWAIDGGEAIFGFFKFLPLPLYSLVLMQEEGGKEKVKENLPYVVAVMTILSLALMYIPALSSYFSVSGRLSGFVQYPNTFAIILLVCELWLITKEKPEIIDYLCILVLLFGILYTGSRTVFVLALISNLVAIFTVKNKKLRITVLATLGGAVVLVLLYCLITDSFGVISRYLNISVLESTFVGRLLYAQDILPTLLSHPFGIGYMGYYFLQRSVQTGIYSVMFIHNDLLQIALDVGWIPCILLIIAIVKTVLNPAVALRNKIILITFVAHTLFDFDLMYVAVFMMLMLFLQTKEQKAVEIKKKSAAVSLAVVLSCIGLYFGTVQLLTRFEVHTLAAKLYPANTISETALIKEAATPLEAAELGEKIIKRNKYVSVAYSVVGRYAYTKGDFAKVITYKTKTIEAAPFAAGEYKEYATMLINGIKLYTQAGDSKSAQICKDELLALDNLLAAQRERVSTLGSKIDPQPTLYFPTDIAEQIKALREEN